MRSVRGQKPYRPIEGLTASGRTGDQATVGFWLEKAEAEKERVGPWKLRLEMQQARSGNTSMNTV